MKLFLLIVAILICPIIADGHAPARSSFYVPADTILEITDTGMCNKLFFEIVPIYNMTTIDEKHHSWISVEGFIDGIYTDQCNSTTHCTLSLTTWTTGHNFTYYCKSNVDAYVSHYTIAGSCGPTLVYIVLAIIGGVALIASIFVIIVIIQMLVVIVMHYYNKYKKKERTSKTSYSEEIAEVEVTISEEKN